MAGPDPSRKRRLPKGWRGKFIASLAEHGVVQQACEESGVGRSSAYKHRQEDSDFAEAWDEAVEASTDLMIAEARRRAVQGVDEPVFYGGSRVGTIRKYSDSLLMFLIKARRPEYRDSQGAKDQLPEANIGIDPEVAAEALRVVNSTATEGFRGENCGGAS